MYGDAPDTVSVSTVTEPPLGLGLIDGYAEIPGRR